MENKKEYCAQIFDEYKKIHEQFKSGLGDPRKRSGFMPNFKEDQKRKDLRDKLIKENCLPELKDEDLYYLWDHEGLEEESRKILRERQIK